MEIFIIFILLVSELGLVLAQIGHFPLTAIFLLALIILLSIFRIRQGVFNLRAQLSGIFHIAILLLILLVATILFFQPYQYMDGGWDPGAYINTGCHIARTGSLVYNDKFLQESAAFIRKDGTGIKYPGLYIKDINKGLVVPQFFYLYPVWIAVFYKLFGLPAVFYVNPLFALCSAILIFLLVQKVIGRNYALIAAFLFAVNPIQIWNARFSTSEILGQFLLLGGFYLWLKYIDTEDRFFAFWSGVAFGEFLLVSITSLLVIPIIFINLFYRHNKKDIWFILPFALLAGHLIIQLCTFSSIYLESVIMSFHRKEVYISLGAFILFLALIIAFRKFLKIPSIILILSLFGYGYFIRPHIHKSIEALNLIEFGNYVSLIGLILAVTGLCLLIHKEKREGVVFFALTALLWAVFFIYDKRMFSRYPFALRRYIPVVVPAYCLFVSYFFWCVNHRFKILGRLFSVAAICLLVIIPFKKCKDIIMVRDNYGWVRFWSLFTKHMNPDTIYITNHYSLARPLKDIFGFETVYVNHPDKFALSLIKKGGDVQYILNLPISYSLYVDFIEKYRQSIRFKYLEHSLKFPPKVRGRNLCFKIFEIIPIEQTDVSSKDEYTIHMGGDTIGFLKGFDKFRQFSGGISGRWTLDKAKLVIPWFGDKTSQILIIRGCGMPEKAGISLVSIYIDNQLIIENYPFGHEINEYTFTITPEKINTGNKKRVTLCIKSSTWDPAKHGIKGYPNQLGILIDWIKIRKSS